METVYVLCDSGSVMEHNLPLPAGIADRVERGELQLVNADGSSLPAPGEELAAKESARRTRKTQPAAQ